MSKGAGASVDRLNLLHKLLVEIAIKDIEDCKEGDIPIPAANLAVYRQLLKDNEITASIDADDMKALKDEFKNELDAKRQAEKDKLLASALTDDDTNRIYM